MIQPINIFETIINHIFHRLKYQHRFKFEDAGIILNVFIFYLPVALFGKNN